MACVQVALLSQGVRRELGSRQELVQQINAWWKKTWVEFEWLILVKFFHFLFFQVVDVLRWGWWKILNYRLKSWWKRNAIAILWACHIKNAKPMVTSWWPWSPVTFPVGHFLPSSPHESQMKHAQFFRVFDKCQMPRWGLVECGSRHTLCLTFDGLLVGFGCNTEGAKGEDEHSLCLFLPRKLKENMESRCQGEMSNSKPDMLCFLFPVSPFRELFWVVLGGLCQWRWTNPFINHIWVFPKIEVPQNGWFIMENPWKTLLKGMIWRKTHYFWKHPYVFSTA